MGSEMCIRDREKRIAAEAEMAKMENDLKGKLLEIRGGV